MSDCIPRGREFDPCPDVDIDHKIIPTAFSSLPLIQEGLLSVTSDGMCTKYWGLLGCFHYILNAPRSVDIFSYFGPFGILGSGRKQNAA